MRLANEICAAAMEQIRAELRPGMKESEAAAIWQGFVHGEGTARADVELALAFSLVWSGQGIKTFTATGDRPVTADEPTLFEIWVCADGYWADHTKNLLVGELRDDYRELEERLVRLRPRDRPLRAGRELRRARRARPRRARRGRLPGAAVASDLPRRRRARPRAAVRPSGRRRQGRGGDGAGDRAGCYWEGGGGLRVEDNFLIDERGRREALVVPGRRGEVLRERPDLDRRR